MVEREGVRRPAGELVFSDDELGDMGVALASDPGRVRKRPPKEPRRPDGFSDGMATVRQPAFTPIDMTVEAAFERVNGKAAKAPVTLESPWAGDDDGIEPPMEEEAAEVAEVAEVAEARAEPPPEPPLASAPPPVLSPPLPRSTAPMAAVPTIVAAPPPIPAAVTRPPVPEPASAPTTSPEAVFSSSPAPDLSLLRPAGVTRIAGPVVVGNTLPGPRAASRGDEPEVLDSEDVVEVPAGQRTPPAVQAAPAAVRAGTPASAAPAAPAAVSPPVAVPAPATAPPKVPAAPAPAAPVGPAISTAPPPVPAAAGPAAAAAVAPPLPVPAAPPLPPAASAAPPAVTNGPVVVVGVGASPPPVPATASAAAPQAVPIAPPPVPSAVASPPAAVPVVAVPPPVPPPAATSAMSDPAAAARRKRRSKQWFEEIFDEDYLRTLPYMTAGQTEREANFIAEALKLEAGASVLDVACGYGRHALDLAARGLVVSGIDLSLPLLIRAADAARRNGVNVNFVHGDMREMTFEEEFDAAYCCFTSFGYFEEEVNRKVAAQIAKALKPGGRLLLELINRDHVIGELPTRVWWQGDGCMVLEEVDFNYFTSRLQNHRSVVFEDGRQLEQEISIRAYSLHEIGQVLHGAGFRVTEVSGDSFLRGRFFGAESRQLLIVAEKK